jgi:hypothetical protein
VIRIKGWHKYQSYKDRKPPWIRLHKSLLDDFEFQSMSITAKALLPMLWLLASEDEDPTSGVIRDSYDKLAFRLRMDITLLIATINEIHKSGFLEIDKSDLQTLTNKGCNETVTKQLRIRNETVTDSYRNRTETVTPETEMGPETDKSGFSGTIGLVLDDDKSDLQTLTNKGCNETVTKPYRNRNETVTPEAYKQQRHINNRKRIKTFSPAFSEEDLEVAARMLDLKSVLYPHHKKPNLDTWAKTIRLMRTTDKHGHEEIDQIYEWVMQDDFWGTVCLSPENLRKNWDKIQVARSRTLNTAKTWQEKQDQEFLKEN